MNRLVLIVVLVLAGAAIALPPVVGSRTQTIIRSQIEQMDENPLFALRVADYQRNWFSSQAQVEITLDERYLGLIEPDQTDADPGNSITIPVDIAHGPIILMDGLYFGWSRLHAILDDRDELAAMLTSELGIDHLAELRGQVSYFGTFSFDASVPPVEYLDESGQFSFSGIGAQGSLRNANLVVEGNMDRLEMDSIGTAITIENVSMASDSTRINQLLWAGDVAADIERMTIVDTLAGAAGAVELSGLRMTGNVELDDTGELMDMSATYAADTIRLPEEDSEVTDAELALGLDNISVSGLTAYYQTFLNFDAQNPDDLVEVVPAIVAGILAEDPSLSLDPIRFTLDGESLNASVNVRTVGGDQIDVDLLSMLMMLGLFEATAEINASKILVHRLAGEAAAAQIGAIDPAELPPGQDIDSMAAAQVEMMLIGVLGQGYIVDDGDNYSTVLEYAGGELLINGSPLPLGAFLR